MTGIVFSYRQRQGPVSISRTPELPKYRIYNQAIGNVLLHLSFRSLPCLRSSLANGPVTCDDTDGLRRVPCEMNP